jgi:hypothetical protein
MKVPGRIYNTSDGRQYLALYNYFPDVYRMPPPSARNAERVAHVDYAFAGFRRGIDVFLLGSSLDLRDVDLKKDSRLQPGQMKVGAVQGNSKRRDAVNSEMLLGNVDVDQDVKYEVAAGYPHTGEILNAIRFDIFCFCESPAKNPDGTRIDYVDSIKPRPVIRKVIPKILLVGGKQEYVPSCSLSANLDFSYGCVSGLVNGFLDVFAECEYCYGIYNHKTFSKYVVNIDKAHLREELQTGTRHVVGPVKVLRLGKRTEAGSSYTLDSLVLTLETCLETKTRVVMPTKYLVFDKEVAGLLKRTNSALLYSIGYDALERGACSHGCNNEFRLEQAAMYGQEGVNSVLNLLIDLPHDATQRDIQVLDYAHRQGLPVQLLPIRIQGKKVAKAVTGLSWNALKESHASQPNLPFASARSLPDGGYESNSGYLRAKDKSPFWSKLFAENTGKIRMCHHDSEDTYCGRCFLDNKGFVKPTEHVEIKYNRVRKANWRRVRKPKGFFDD